MGLGGADGRPLSEPGLFVISRSSAFSYKGGPVKIADPARGLGGRYVVEGSRG